MYTLFNLRKKFSKNTAKVFLLFAFMLMASSATFAQGVTMVVNATTTSDTGSEDANNVIDYSVAIRNTGGVPLTNVMVASSLTLSPALTLESGDTNGNNILDIDECWVYTGSYTMSGADVTATKVDNIFSVTSTEITTAETFMHSENVHEDDISFASIFAIRDLIANDDDYSATDVNGITGGTAGNVLTNDKVDNITATSTTAIPTLLTNGGLTGVTIDATGNVIVPANSATGTYTLTYKICENGNTNNCDNAQIIVKVDGDTDGDGVLDSVDICNGFDDNADNDTDGVPDGCDEDDDNDGILDVNETPGNVNPDFRFMISQNRDSSPDFIKIQIFLTM